MVYDLIVIGSGAAGMMAAITAARRQKRVLLLEKLPVLGAKLKATGGGRCNVTNTLPKDRFMECFGRQGRFMSESLQALDHHALVEFFRTLGVECHAPDGYRVFPVSHNALSILNALEAELHRLNVDIRCSERVESWLYRKGVLYGVMTTQQHQYEGTHVIVATGGLGYPRLGAEGDGYVLAQSIGHTVTALHPAMIPLYTKEPWVKRCRADTIAKAELRISLPKAKKLRAVGDLIFTTQGIRGPVVLDFAREITPLLERYGEVPLHINVVQGMNEAQILEKIHKALAEDPHQRTRELLSVLIPDALSRELCAMASLDPERHWNKQPGGARHALLNLLVKMPLTVVGHGGFNMAMITRGGVTLKEVDPRTMRSRLIDNLYFCGEVLDLDGPCGGYNLQWSFSSGYLAGMLGEFTCKKVKTP
ncbi:MAG: NAD(P)/FAD-dependent oxidoreductase [Sulfurimonas sp.]|nr:MAG: NAD(P)/FAD-dependent oxidoreductase [Sulfurimonas sp.]